MLKSTRYSFKLNSPDACDALLCAILLLSSVIDGPDASVGIKLVVHCSLFQVSCSHLESSFDFRNELQLLFCQNELDAPHFRAFVFRRSFQHPGEAEISTSTARCFLVPECQVTMNFTFKPFVLLACALIEPVYSLFFLGCRVCFLHCWHMTIARICDYLRPNPHHKTIAELGRKTCISCLLHSLNFGGRSSGSSEHG